MSKIESKKNKHGRIGFRVLVAAAIVAVMAMSVAATGVGTDAVEWFKSFFAAQSGQELSTQQQNVVDAITATEEQSDSSADYTVTLESVSGDNGIAYLKFRITAPVGVTLDAKAYYFADCVMPEPAAGRTDAYTTTISTSWIAVEDDNKQDNQVSVILRYSDDGIDMAEEESLTLTLGKLYASPSIYRQDPEKDELVAEGNWSFTFSLNEKTASSEKVELIKEPVACTGSKFMGEGKVTVQITSFELRPLSAVFVAEYAEDTKAYEFDDAVYLDGLCAVMKDGSKVDFDQRSVTSLDGNRCEHTCYFDAPIDLDEVAYIELPGDIQIPVNE